MPDIQPPPGRLKRAQLWARDQIRANKPSFLSKSPHFNFISAHYFWIVSMTFLASILIIASSGGNIRYIDALFFASGANTQAGLNTVDLNSLNTFQQVCIYIFTMASNPISIHSTVVFLRLYWFEKRFRSLVKDARARRVTVTKSRNKTQNKARDDPSLAERGVAGRHITLMPNSGKKITNDGMLVDPNGEASASSSAAEPPSTANTSGSTTDESADPRGSTTAPTTPAHPTQITFSDTVVRSDGLDSDTTKFPPISWNPDSPAISESRSDNVEVLRIPNPRDAEMGVGPKALEEGDAPEPEDEVDENNTRVRAPAESRLGPPPPSPNATLKPRKPTITIAEPPKPAAQAEKPKRTGKQPQQLPSRKGIMEDLSDNASIVGNMLEPLKFRMPRVLQPGNKKYHVDSDDENAVDDTTPADAPVRTHRVRRRTFDAIRGVMSQGQVDEAPYLSWTPTLGRNSQFIGLSQEQREELGGIEYRSLRTLALILVLYFWGFWIFALTCLLPWILSSANEDYARVVDAAGVSRAWWGFFTSVSAYLDLGLTLTPDSMNSFSHSQYVLMMMTFLIIIGNTGFPIMLRAIIWIMARIVPRESGLWEELRFLLDHPRRCFTLLFPSGPTWWLFWILIILNTLDLLFFIVLDLNDGAVSELPVHLRFVNGIFQAACTRTAGFSSINISLLHPAVQVSYMMMMYISVFPIAISIRRTNVYEKESLGYDGPSLAVYGPGDEDESVNESKGGMSFVGNHLRRQLSFDLWYVFLGLFILSISEGPKIQRGEFDVYSVLFEIVSAYGTVGLSLGYPGVNTSLSGQFTTVGKLVIIAMQIRGRHRGLPYALDRAVLLPSESRFKEEEEEAQQPPMTHQLSTATQRTSASATGVDLARGRSRDRGIFTSFLHPGPPMPRDQLRARNRRASSEARIGPLGEHAGDNLQRARTEPVDDLDLPNQTAQHMVPRHVMTMPAV